MRSEKDFQRLEQSGRFSGTFEQTGNFGFVPVRHRGDYGFLVLKIAVDQADADSSFGANIMHASLVKSVLGEAGDGGLEDLGPAIENGGVSEGLRHEPEQ